MPIFEYKCLSCSHVFEVMVQRTGSGPKPACPECGQADPERLWSPISGGTGKTGSCGGGVPGFR
ncbi:MAG TPA: zinc ribbon domain-containing protein [Candidatus Acidoferrum sp.]|nr:zinc ribbon domain-containing protein [Candidatus Acidoferrum sp.]